MKFVLGTILLLAAQFSLAGYNWSLVNSDHHYGDSQEEITKILASYPEILQNSEFEAKDIDFVSVTESEFEFVGETTCQADDERLTHHSLTYFACPTGKPTECITKFGEILTNSDPCL